MLSYSPAKTRHALRVALVAGTLGQGGAEKQLVYIAQALHQANVAVRVYTLTHGGFYEPVLRASGIEVVWVGRLTNPLLRIISLARALRQFRPDIVQATHSYINLHVAIVGRLLRTTAIGSIRSNVYLELKANGLWGPMLLNVPPILLANSYRARVNAGKLGFRASKIHVLPNVVNLGDFDFQVANSESGALSASQSLPTTCNPLALAVGRLLPEKRFDRFLMALARARSATGTLKGALIGDGRERPNLEALANDLGLLPDGLTFMGRRNDVPALLGQASMLLLTSDHEGFPNVLLEAMAARLPIITTPAGDAGAVVQDGVTGYVVPFDDIDRMAELMVRLTQSPNLGCQLGVAGRKRVEEFYSIEGLAERLMQVYIEIAKGRT